ncbi:MAG: hypothetical protein EZS28_050620, partial [Streblomastix strix]
RREARHIRHQQRRERQARFQQQLYDSQFEEENQSNNPLLEGLRENVLQGDFSTDDLLIRFDNNGRMIFVDRAILGDEESETDWESDSSDTDTDSELSSESRQNNEVRNQEENSSQPIQPNQSTPAVGNDLFVSTYEQTELGNGQVQNENGVHNEIIQQSGQQNRTNIDNQPSSQRAENEDLLSRLFNQEDMRQWQRRLTRLRRQEQNHIRRARRQRQREQRLRRDGLWRQADRTILGTLPNGSPGLPGISYIPLVCMGIGHVRDGIFRIAVQRRSLIASSLAAFTTRHGPGAWRLPLRVVFSGETAIDIGGVRREWFVSLVHALTSPELGLFEANPSNDYRLSFSKY